MLSEHISVARRPMLGCSKRQADISGLAFRGPRSLRAYRTFLRCKRQARGPCAALKSAHACHAVARLRLLVRAPLRHGGGSIRSPPHYFWSNSESWWHQSSLVRSSPATYARPPSTGPRDSPTGFSIAPTVAPPLYPLQASVNGRASIILLYGESSCNSSQCRVTRVGIANSPTEALLRNSTLDSTKRLRIRAPLLEAHTAPKIIIATRHGGRNCTLSPASCSTLATTSHIFTLPQKTKKIQRHLTCALLVYRFSVNLHSISRNTAMQTC